MMFLTNADRNECAGVAEMVNRPIQLTSAVRHFILQIQTIVRLIRSLLIGIYQCRVIKI